MKTLTASRPKPASLDFAREVHQRGTNCLDSALVADALGITLLTPRAPLFTEDEHRAAKSRNEQLIWLPSRDSKGVAVTMKRLHTSLGNKSSLGGKLLCSTDWYKEEPFFTTDAADTNGETGGSWRFVGTTAIPGTKGENYQRQTLISAAYVRETIFGGSPPETFAKILAEPEEREEEIAALIQKDWKEGGEVLVNLPFNQLFRESPVEAFIRVIVNQQVNKTRLLEDEYSWTKGRSRYGGLVRFGNADEDGASLDDWLPRRAHGCVGFFLSRSDTVGSEA